VRNNHNSSVFVGDQAFHFIVAFLFKLLIAYTENLVNKHDICFQNSCNGKGQFGIHTAGVGSYGFVNKISKLCKVYNLLLFGMNLFF